MRVEKMLRTLHDMLAWRQAKVQRGKENGKTLHYEAAESAALKWIMDERDRLAKEIERLERINNDLREHIVEMRSTKNA
jgi:hypothetical protein